MKGPPGQLEGPPVGVPRRIGWVSRTRPMDVRKGTEKPLE